MELLRTQGSEYFGTYLSFASVCSHTRNRRKDSPCDRLDFRDLARIQRSVRCTTKCGTDVKSDNEFSRRARIIRADCVHSGGQGKAADRGSNRSAKYLRTPFTGVGASHHIQPFPEPPPASHTMSQSLTFGSFSPRECESEQPTESQDEHASPLGSPGNPEETDETRDAARPEDLEENQSQREIGEPKGPLDEEKSAIARGRRGRDTWMGKYGRRDSLIMELEDKMGEMRGFYERVVEGQARQIRAMGEHLERTEELLAARSAELAGAHTFLSTKDRLSEAEVLSIVNDINENIFQVAVNLTEEWGKLKSSQATGRMDFNLASRPHVPVLVQLALDREPTGLTPLLQSCLCYHATVMIPSWGYYQELDVLESVYQRLSASGEHQIEARDV